MTRACPECGHPLSEHDRHVRYALPDVVLERGMTVESGGLWLSHATPRESVMMAAEGVGAFVRALVPVRLNGGHSVTFGVWIGVPVAEMHRALSEWFAPSYPDLLIDGHLANELPPWSVRDAPVRLAVIDPDHTPYVTSSSDVELSGVLHDVWDHESVLSTLPH